MYAAQLTYIMVHVRVDGPTLIRIHSYVHLHVASPKERAGLTMGAGMAVLDTVVLRAGRGNSHYKVSGR